MAAHLKGHEMDGKVDGHYLNGVLTNGDVCNGGFSHGQYHQIRRPIVNNTVLPKFNKIESGLEQNGVVQPLLTDMYEITMAYAYWKSDKKDNLAVFDLFFRKNPFSGEFALFAGLEECLKYLQNFSFSEQDLKYLREILPPSTEEEFFDYLASITTKDIVVYAIDEGTAVFPKVPLLQLEGPLPIVQMLETTLLNLINYASLVATNAARFRLAAGPDKSLLEFGLRRAQGPDGALSASKYCYLGGFDGTSNLLAGKLFGIPVRGTHAHAFVNSYNSIDDLSNRILVSSDGKHQEDLVTSSLEWKNKLAPVLGILSSETNIGEFAAFVAYAMAFPTGFLCLVDTYDVIRSGVPNFCAVAMALHELGYRAVGIRLDSGDLAYLSQVVRMLFEKISILYGLDWFKALTIVASNDINEDTIHSLNHQEVVIDTGMFEGHCIDSFGIGTHLVTCQKQPALGCVYKLAEINSQPRIKLSADIEKVTIPGRKVVYRLYGSDGHALVDLMQLPDEPVVVKGQRVLCRHPFQEAKRAYVIPAHVEPLYKCYYRNGQVCQPLPTLEQIRNHAQESLKNIRMDHKRALNPTPYKVSVTDQLYTFIHTLWLENAPIGELS